MTPTAEQQSIIEAAVGTTDSLLIPLSQGLSTIIDAADYNRLMSINTKWFAHKSRYTHYAECKLNGRVIRMHRIIMNAPEGMEVDHKDKNGLNNKKENLRVVTSTENKQNKRNYSNNRSGVQGVYFAITARGRKYWHAQITRDGRQKLIGRFLTRDEAIKARLEAENAYSDE